MMLRTAVIKGCWEMAVAIKCPGLTAKYPSTHKKPQHDKLWVCRLPGRN